MKQQRDTEGEEESDRVKGPGEIQKEVTRVLRRWKEGAWRDVSWSIRGRMEGRSQRRRELPSWDGPRRKDGRHREKLLAQPAVHLGLDPGPALASRNGDF